MEIVLDPSVTTENSLIRLLEEECQKQQATNSVVDLTFPLQESDQKLRVISNTQRNLFSVTRIKPGEDSALKEPARSLKETVKVIWAAQVAHLFNIRTKA